MADEKFDIEKFERLRRSAAAATREEREFASGREEIRAGERRGAQNASEASSRKKRTAALPRSQAAHRFLDVLRLVSAVEALGARRLRAQPEIASVAQRSGYKASSRNKRDFFRKRRSHGALKAVSDRKAPRSGVAIDAGRSGAAGEDGRWRGAQVLRRLGDAVRSVRRGRRPIEASEAASGESARGDAWRSGAAYGLASTAVDADSGGAGSALGAEQGAAGGLRERALAAWRNAAAKREAAALGRETNASGAEDVSARGRAAAGGRGGHIASAMWAALFGRGGARTAAAARGRMQSQPRFDEVATVGGAGDEAAAPPLRRGEAWRAWRDSPRSGRDADLGGTTRGGQNAAGGFARSSGDLRRAQSSASRGETAPQGEGSPSREKTPYGGFSSVSETAALGGLASSSDTAQQGRETAANSASAEVGRRTSGASAERRLARASEYLRSKDERFAEDLRSKASATSKDSRSDVERLLRTYERELRRYG